MYEVELKVPADHDAVRERLRDLGADTVGTVRQVDTYYDPPHRDFAATDEALRVRFETHDGEREARLTYKGPLVEQASKTREEVEIGVDDGTGIQEILERLGFDPAATVEKDRATYAHDGYTITLDDVDDLGQFVEVEVETEAEDVQSAREGARDVLRDLGLDPDDHVRTSYLELLLEAG